MKFPKKIDDIYLEETGSAPEADSSPRMTKINSISNNNIRTPSMLRRGGLLPINWVVKPVMVAAALTGGALSAQTLSHSPVYNTIIAAVPSNPDIKKYFVLVSLEAGRDLSAYTTQDVLDGKAGDIRLGDYGPCLQPLVKEIVSQVTEDQLAAVARALGVSPAGAKKILSLEETSGIFGRGLRQILGKDQIDSTTAREVLGLPSPQVPEVPQAVDHQTELDSLTSLIQSGSLSRDEARRAVWELAKQMALKSHPAIGDRKFPYDYIGFVEPPAMRVTLRGLMRQAEQLPNKVAKPAPGIEPRREVIPKTTIAEAPEKVEPPQKEIKKAPEKAPEKPAAAKSRPKFRLPEIKIKMPEIELPDIHLDGITLPLGRIFSSIFFKIGLGLIGILGAGLISRRAIQRSLSRSSKKLEFLVDTITAYRNETYAGLKSKLRDLSHRIDSIPERDSLNGNLRYLHTEASKRIGEEVYRLIDLCVRLSDELLKIEEVLFMPGLKNGAEIRLELKKRNCSIDGLDILKIRNRRALILFFAKKVRALEVLVWKTNQLLNLAQRRVRQLEKAMTGAEIELKRKPDPKAEK